MNGGSRTRVTIRSTPFFTPQEAGTPEPDWLFDQRWDAVSAASANDLAPGVERVVVLAAHPDDELLGAGATLGDLARHVSDVVVVLATDGERSHPAGTFAAELATLRRSEARRGLDHVAPQAQLLHLALPDGRLHADADEVASALTPLLGPSTLLLAPWQHDGHPDHEAAGQVAAAAAAAASARLLQFPIWLWHWGRPDELPWKELVLVNPSADALHAKRAGIAEHRTQVLAPGPRPGETPLLGRHVLRHFERVVEVFVGPMTPPVARPADRSDDAFDRMYDRGKDPWGFEASWYEQRKRSLTTAMLTRQRYDSVLEIGCATGVLTRAVAERADHVTGLDVSARALHIARRAAADADIVNVSWLHAAAPGALPRGPFDLIILSEVGYFLTGAQWLGTLRRVRSALQPGGDVVLVHWRRRTDGIPLDGPLVQRQARDALGLTVRARYADDDVEIDVLGDGASVAQQEGLA